MESDKEQAIERLIDVFARDFPRKNHIIVVDMSTGSCRVDEMLALEIRRKEDLRSARELRVSAMPNRIKPESSDKLHHMMITLKQMHDTPERRKRLLKTKHAIT